MGDGGARAPSEVGGPGSWGARESRRRVQPLHPRVYKATWRNHGRSGAVQTWAHGKGSEQGERSASSGFPENTRFFSVTSGAPEFPVSLLPPPSPSPISVLAWILSLGSGKTNVIRWRNWKFCWGGRPPRTKYLPHPVLMGGPRRRFPGRKAR